MTTREQLAEALRAMLAVYCGDEGDTPDKCQAAERQAREALAQAEGGEQ